MSLGFEVSSWHANAMEFVFTRSKLAAREEARIQNLIQKQIPSTRASPRLFGSLRVHFLHFSLQFSVYAFRISHLAFRFCFCFCLLCFISCCCCSFAVAPVCDQLDWKLYTINFRCENCKQAITFCFVKLFKPISDD